MTRRSKKMSRARWNPHTQFKSDTSEDSGVVISIASSPAPLPRPVTLIDTGKPRNGNPIFEAVTPIGPATIQEIANLCNEQAGKTAKSTPSQDLKPAPWKVRDPWYDNLADDRCAQCNSEPDGSEYTIELPGSNGFAVLHPECFQFFVPRRSKGSSPDLRNNQGASWSPGFHQRKFTHKCSTCGDQATYSRTFQDKVWFCREHYIPSPEEVVAGETYHAKLAKGGW
jgi:ribosomal protein L37AE/L43A